MKSLQDFKTILTEEEKSDYTKFDALVRAGLANKAQIQRMHKILDKMGEERPQFTNADKMIIQNLFTKMVDLITNNKQIYSQTRRAVREELEEGIVDTSDYRLGADGRKVRAHRVKVGDTAPEVGDDPEADKDIEDRERRMANREKGIGRAVKKITKEEIETIEERSLTASESKKKEEIVMSMKKGLSGFKERYGKDAKSVMYATATKNAKKD
jgi:hypothetical protein